MLIILISLALVNNAFAQLSSSKPQNNPVAKLTATDSLRRHSNIQYFKTPVTGKDEYVLSVDQSKVVFLYGSKYDNAREYYVQVPVKLTNKSADTLKYRSMSCSWWDIYRTDNQKLKVFAPDICWKNSEITCLLPPYKEVVKYVIVVVPKEKSKLIIFKVGMAIQKEPGAGVANNVKTAAPTSLVPLKKRVIWSNYISVSQWHGK